MMREFFFGRKFDYTVFMKLQLKKIKNGYNLYDLSHVKL